MRRLVLFLLFVVISNQLYPQTAESPKADSLKALCKYLKKNKIFNGNILVAEQGQLLCECSIGYADVQTKQSLTPGSVFELASVSKQFTASGILVLVEEGDICVDQLIEFILPDFPYMDITIRNLLTHTSGLPDYMDLFGQYWDKSQIATNRDVLDMIRQHKPPVHFAPGEQWEYSNTGYVMLACIIEEISGMPFADFMKQNVFEPIGLNNTLVYSRRSSDEVIQGYAYGYVKDYHLQKYILPDSMPSMDYVYYLDGIQGDGSVHSTSRDLMKWCQVVGDRGLFDGKWWDEALTPFVLGNGDTTDYGFGWNIRHDPGDGLVISHGGGWPGYRTFDIHYMDKDITIVYLCNMEPAGVKQRQIIQSLKDIATGKPVEWPSVPERKKIARIDKSVYPVYEGTYSQDSTFSITVTTDDGKLMIQSKGGSLVEVLPEGKGRFFVPGSETGMEFLKDDSGKISSLAIYQQGTIVLFKEP